MEQLSLVVVRNPFDRGQRSTEIVLASAKSILDLYEEYAPAGLEMVASLNGAIIGRERWAAICPRNGDQLVLIPALQGSDALRGIAFLAVAFSAGPVAAMFAEGLGTAAYFSAFVGALVVGGMVVNHLLPPPKPAEPSQTGVDISPSYSWNPATTQVQGGAVPRWYGTTKLYGNVISAYVEDLGNKQYLNMLIDLGQGPYSRLYDFKINDQPAGNFQGVTIETRLGNLDQDVIPAFNDTRAPYPVAVKVVNGTPYTYSTVGTDFDGLEVEITFPNGLFYANDSGGLDNYAVSFRIEARKTGTSDPWMPLTRQVVSSTQWQTFHRWSAGRWVEASYQSVWDELAAGGSDPNEHYEGQPYYVSGDQIGLWSWIEEGRYVPTEAPVDYVTVSAAQSQVVRRMFKLGNLSHGGYDIRVTNLTTDQTSSRYGDDLYLTSVSEVYYDDFQYPRTVLAAVRALATEQLSGSIKFSCLADGALVRVWNGSTWNVEFSANNAWVCYDILTQPVLNNSLDVVRHDGIDPARLTQSLPEFLSWSQFCDGMVSDGNGGTEVRCRFDGGFDTETTMWDAAQAVAGAARAALIPFGSRLGVFWDRPQSTPAQLFTVSNIGAGSFKEVFLSQADRAAEIEIDFQNEDNDFAREKFTVINSAMEDHSNRITMNLVGVTRPSQAWRDGMFRLNRNQTILRAGEYGADIDSIVCQVGNLILLQHDVPGWGAGGRATGGIIGSIVLDQTVTVEAGKTYAVTVRFADDTLATRTVTNAVGDHSTLTVTPDFPQAPTVNDVYAFGESTSVTKPVLVVGLSRAGDQTCLISWVEYNETVYNCDTDEPALPTPNYSSFERLPAVTDLTIAENLLRQRDGSIVSVIEATWRMPAGTFVANVEIWYDDGGGWRFGDISNGQFARIWNVRTGVTYQMAAVTVNVAGEHMRIQNAPKASITILGKEAKPPRPDIFLFGRQPDGTREFTWTLANPPSDLDGFLIRYYIGSTSDWNIMIPMHGGILTSSKYETNQLAAGTYTFAIKSIDTSQNESEDALFIETSIGDPRMAGVIEDVEEAPGWTGIKSYCHVDTSTGWLVADGVDTWADLPATWAGWTSWNMHPVSPIQYTREIDIGAVASFTPLVSINCDGSAVLEEQHSSDGINWTAPALIGGQIQARWINIIATVTGAYPIVRSMRTFLNAQTIEEIIEDQDSAALTGAHRIGTGDIRLPIIKSYAVIKKVDLTLQSVSGGWTWVLIDKDTAVGPRVKIYNSSLALADAVFDATVTGL